MPDAFLDRPSLSEEAVPFWRAFQFLHMSRPNTGFGPGAIPLSEMLGYADLMQLPTGEIREEFAYVLRTLDGAYLDWVREKHG